MLRGRESARLLNTSLDRVSSGANEGGRGVVNDEACKPVVISSYATYGNDGVELELPTQPLCEDMEESIAYVKHI